MRWKMARKSLTKSYIPELRVNMNCGCNPYSYTVKRDHRFKKVVTVINGSDPRINKRPLNAKRTVKAAYNALVVLFKLSFIGLLLLTGILGTLNNKSVAKSNTAPNIEVKQNVALASVSEKKIIEPAPAVVAPKPLTIKELIAKYFPENTKLAIAIADCESSFDPKQINEKGKDMSYGLFQINIKGKLAIGRPSKQELFNPEINVKTARKIYEQSGYTFKKDWVVCSQINQNLQ